MNDKLNVTQEQDLERKRDKAILKGKITLIIFILISLIITGIVFLIIKIINKPNKKPEKPIMELGEVTSYTKVNNLINFIDDNNNIVYTYNCINFNCKEANTSYSGFNDLKDLNIMLIEDDSKYVLYNYKTGAIVSSYYENIDIVKTDTKTKYFIYKNYNMYGLLNLDGTVKTDPQYQLLYLNDYNTDSNNLIFQNYEKQGIINYENNSIIIPNIYDSIVLYDNYFVGIINNESYLLNYNNEKIFNNVYDKLYIFDECVVTILNNELYIKDYSENNLHENAIKTYLNSDTDNIISIENGIIKILIHKYVDENQTEKETIEYEYDINSKILTQK